MQPAAFTPTRKAASGRLDPPHLALFGPSLVTQVQRPDPRDSGARGVARPKPGLGRGAGPPRRDVTPGRMAARVLKPDQACLPQCSLHAHSGKLLRGGWTLPHVALFGPSLVTQVQRPDPRDSGARGVASPNPGPGSGARPARRDGTPSRVAARVLKPHQSCLPECNQQPSRPPRRLLRGGWTPHIWPFSGLAW